MAYHRSKSKKGINIQNILLVIIVLFYIFTRTVDLHKGLTVDEPNWIGRSSNYLHALSSGNFIETYQAPHPGVTTTVAGALGIIIKQPVALINSVIQSPIQQSVLDIYFARFGIFILNTLFLGLILYLLVIRFKNPDWAIMFFILVTFEPYVIGLSRIIHVDTILSYPVVLAMLYIILFFKENNKRDLLSMSFFFALSALTKTPSIFFVGYSFMLVLLFKNGKQNIFHTLFVTLQGFIASGLMAFLLWPVLWVDPVYAVKNMLSVASPGINKIHRLSDSDTLFYAKAIFHFITPVYSILFLVSIIVVIWLYVKKHPRWKDLLAMQLFTIGFIIFMGLFTKKAERYIMPSYVSMALVGGFILAYIKNVCSKYSNRAIWLYNSILGVFVCVYAIISLSQHPYYISYYNPWISKSGLQRIGLGEGIDQAVAYINSLPNSEDVVIASWYDSTAGLYSVGTVKDLQYYKDADVDYIITYRNMYDRPPEELATKILNETSNLKPIKTIYIHSLPFAWVYKK